MSEKNKKTALALVQTGHIWHGRKRTPEFYADCLEVLSALDLIETDEETGERTILPDERSDHRQMDSTGPNNQRPKITTRFTGRKL